MFTGTNRFGDEQQLDKNLANILLATHAARFLVKILPSEVEKEQLMKAIWMSLVATFVVQGRPKVTARAVSTHPSMAEVNPQDSHHDPMSEDEEYKESRSGSMAVSDFETDVRKATMGRWRALSQEALHADHPLVPKVQALETLHTSATYFIRLNVSVKFDIY